MSENLNGRRNFLKTALVSAGAVVGSLAARTVAHAQLTHAPMVREMWNRVRKSSISSHDEESATLCNKAACNPGCDSGCSGGCQASCKPGNK